MVTLTNPRGFTTAGTYDELNRLIETVNGEGGKVRLTYDAVGRIVLAIDEDGATTRYYYDAKGRVTKVEDAYGHYRLLEYDARDRVVGDTDENGVLRSFGYDAVGNLVSYTDGLGNSEHYTYDALGRRVSSTDRNGGVYAYSYDALGRVTSRTDPLGGSTTFGYDAASRIVSTTDELGNATRYVLDGNGNIMESIDALGHSSYFEYDAMDRLSAIRLWRIDPLHAVNEEQVTLFTYDHRGLQVTEVNALGVGRYMVYDGCGNLVAVTDEDGFVTEYSYTPMDLVSDARYADGKQANFAYDGTGDLVALVDWTGETAFAYDLLGRLIEVVDPAGLATRYGYDAVGNKTSIGYPDGGQVDYFFDAENQIVALSDMTQGDYSFGYDANGNLISKLYPDSEATFYWYDANDRLVERDEYVQGGSKALATTYSWDATGNLLTESVFNHGQSTSGLIGGIISGALTGTGSGKEHTGLWVPPPPMSVDENGNVINPGGNMPPGLQRGIGVPTVAAPGRPGSPLGPTGKPGSGSKAYTYDALGRMVTSTDVSSGGSVSAFTYDSLGNLVSEKVGNKTNDYRYNAMNQLVSRQTVNETITYTYDGRGNRATEIASAGNKKTTYVFDAADRLASVTNRSGDKSVYTYNGLGILVGLDQVMHNGKSYGRAFSVDYTSDELDVLVVNAAGEYQQQYVYRDGERLMQLTEAAASGNNGNGNGNGNNGNGNNGNGNNGNGNGNNGNGGTERKLYVHESLLGTTALYTKPGGQVFEEPIYDAWGVPLSPAKLLNNDNGTYIVADYAGHPYDTVSGLYLAPARAYDPAGRSWISRDPAKDGSSWYAYCYNNPATYTDPTGLYVSADDGQPSNNPLSFASNDPMTLLRAADAVTGKYFKPAECLVAVKTALTWPGEIHRAVQLFICGSSLDIEWEEPIKGGRADLWRESTGEVWEVKPESYNNALGLKRAEKQLLRYVTGLSMIHGNAICGYTNLSGAFPYKNYWVIYRSVWTATCAYGIVIYDYDVNDDNKQYQDGYAREVVQVPAQEPAFIPVIPSPDKNGIRLPRQNPELEPQPGLGLGGPGLQLPALYSGMIVYPAEVYASVDNDTLVLVAGLSVLVFLILLAPELAPAALPWLLQAGDEAFDVVYPLLPQSVPGFQ